MHHKLALPLLVALCISLTGVVEAKSSPNWARNNKVHLPAAKRAAIPDAAADVIILVDPIGFGVESLTNPPPPTTTTTVTTPTSTDTTLTTVPSSSGTSTDSVSTTDTDTATTTATTATTPTAPTTLTILPPTTTADPTTPTTATTPTGTEVTPTTDVPTTTSDPISTVSVSQVTDTPTDTVTVVASPTETPTPTETTTNAPTTTAALTDTATTTSFDISSVLSEILSSITDTSVPTSTTDTSVPTTTNTVISTDTTEPVGPTTITTDTGVPPTTTDTGTGTVTVGPTGPTDTVTTTINTSTVSPTPTTTDPFDPNNTSIFPTSITSLNSDDASTVTTQPPVTLSTPSGFQYLTVSSLDLPPPQSTVTSTLSDPDAPTGSIAISADPSSTPIVVIPNNIPMKIVPADNLAASMTQEELAPYTAITMLFDNSRMPWNSVLNDPQVAGSLLGLFGPTVAHALDIDPSRVITTSLAASVPLGWTAAQPISQISATWNGLIPTDYVSDLSAQLKNYNSKLFTGTTGVGSQLAALLVPTYNIVNNSGGGNGAVAVGANSGGTEAPTDTSKNTIIGVTTTVGVILVLLIAFFLVKMYKRSREQAHRRLSGEPMTGPGMRSYGSQGLTAPGGSTGQRQRDSFFFAEDSLRGYHGEAHGSVEDDDSYTSHQPSQARRAPIQASAISQPILRESSMGNW